MICVIVKGRAATALATEPITTSSVGMEAKISCSDDWDGLARCVIFRGSGTSVDVEALSGDICEVPHEVLATAGGRLLVGVYGTGDEGQRVTPTIWADAGPIEEGAVPSEVEPTPATQSLVDQLLAAAQAAQDAAEDAAEIARSVRDDADGGAFDGADGVSPTVTIAETAGGHTVTIADAEHPGGQSFLVPDGQSAPVDATLSQTGQAADAKATGDVLAQHGGELESMSPTIGSSAYTWNLKKNYNTSGAYVVADGFAVTSQYIPVAPGDRVQRKAPAKDANDKTLSMLINEFDGTTWLRRTGVPSGTYMVVGSDATAIRIAYGYPSDQNVTITQELVDATFAVRIIRAVSIGGGGGTSSYADLTNKPQIGGVTLSGNKSAADLSLATASEVAAKYTKPAGGIPATDLAPAVQTSLGLADTALQSAPVTSVNGQTGVVTLTIPSTATDVGAVAVSQGVAHAGEFVVVGSDGNITTVTLATWQGGSY